MNETVVFICYYLLLAVLVFGAFITVRFLKNLPKKKYWGLPLPLKELKDGVYSIEALFANKNSGWQWLAVTNRMGKLSTDFRVVYLDEYTFNFLVSEKEKHSEEETRMHIIIVSKGDDRKEIFFAGGFKAIRVS